MPDRVIVAGARDITMAIEARRGHADALLAFPRAAGPCRLSPPAGPGAAGASRSISTRRRAASPTTTPPCTRFSISPNVIGIKVATLDSVMTFQRIAAVLRSHPDKLLITGEDRFLGYSVMLGARAALVGMGAALPDLQAELLRSLGGARLGRFVDLSDLCDRLAQVTFIDPMEGYIRRMLWAAAADGALPPEACDDPWGPALPETERAAVERWCGVRERLAADFERFSARLPGRLSRLHAGTPTGSI